MTPSPHGESFENALSIDPLYYPAAASLAALDLRDKKPDEARKRFDKLLAADPKDLRALLAVAELRAQAGASKEELVGLLVNAIKLNPTLAAPRWMLVDLHLRSKDNRAALTVAQEGIAAIPDSHELLDALGRAQLASGDATQAVGTFSKLAGYGAARTGGADAFGRGPSGRQQPGRGPGEPQPSDRNRPHVHARATRPDPVGAERRATGASHGGRSQGAK